MSFASKSSRLMLAFQKRMIQKRDFPQIRGAQNRLLAAGAEQWILEYATHTPLNDEIERLQKRKKIFGRLRRCSFFEDVQFSLSWAD
jgi:hypothetical protein